METLINKFGRFRWGFVSLMFGFLAPGLYQMFVNNLDFVRSEGIEKTIWFAGAVSISTYFILVFETYLLIVIYRFFQFIITGSSSGQQILPYGFLAGNLNILIVWPDNRFDAYSDDFRKYLFVLVDNWEWLFIPICLLCLMILLMILKKIIERMIE